MPVSELLTRISSRELTEWEAFFLMQPFGHDRWDLGFAIVAQTIANVNRRRNHKRYQPKDFMPRWGTKGKLVQSEAEQLEIVEALNRAMGGADLRELD